MVIIIVHSCHGLALAALTWVHSVVSNVVVIICHECMIVGLCSCGECCGGRCGVVIVMIISPMICYRIAHVVITIARPVNGWLRIGDGAGDIGPNNHLEVVMGVRKSVLPIMLLAQKVIYGVLIHDRVEALHWGGAIKR